VCCHGDNNITICYFLVVNLDSEPFTVRIEIEMVRLHEARKTKA
jgi:hypothetical protein